MDQSCGAQRFHCGYCSVASPTLEKRSPPGGNMDQSCGAQSFHCGYCSVASPRDHLQEVTWTNCVEHKASL